jgi:hypothetical protein
LLPNVGGPQQRNSRPQGVSLFEPAQQLQALLAQRLIECSVQSGQRWVAQGLCSKGDGPKARLASGSNSALARIPLDCVLGQNLRSEYFANGVFADGRPEIQASCSRCCAAVKIGDDKPGCLVESMVRSRQRDLAA